MANDNKLSATSGIDTTDFKTGIAEMNRELKVLESGFRASAAELGDWAGTATGLESRIKTLTDSMEIQQRKVSATRTEYERIKAEKGENSRAAQELEIKLNKETETLNKMGVELRTTESSLEELKSGSDEAGDSVEEAGGKFEGFKTVLGGVGAVVQGTVGLVLGLMAAIAAVAGVIGGLVFNTASASAELVDLSSKTGINTERLQEMKYIGDQVGVTLDTMTGAQARLVRSMNEGRDGTGDQAKAFETLGIKVADAEGNLRNTQDVFAETLDALNKIQNPAERDALAMSLFGKSAQELNPLIKAGSDELARLAEKAHEVGAVMSEEDVAAFEAFDDTLASLQAGLKGTLGTLASVFLPGFQAVFDQVGGYLQTFKDIVAGSNGDFGKIAEGLTGLVTQIATDIAAQAPQLLTAGLEIVKSILNAITQALPSLLDAAISILTSLIDFIVQNLPTLIDAGIKIVLTLVDALVQNLPMLVDAALKAVIALANGLAAALPTLIPAIIDAVILIANTLVENYPLLADAAVTLLIGLAEGLITALPVLIAAIPPLIEALLNEIFNAAPKLQEKGGELVGMLAYGILSNLGLLLAAILKLIVVIGEGLLKLPKMAFDGGINFVKGLINGFNSAKDLLFDAVNNLANGMLESITDALEIKSPSRKGINIGKNLGLSLPLGMKEVMRDVQSSFAMMTNQLASSVAGGLSPAAVAGASSNTNNIPVYGNVIIKGDTTPDSLADALVKRY